MLNFDLSNTILTRNPYDRIDTTEVFISDIIAKMAWGEITFKDTNQNLKVEQDYKDATWTLSQRTLSMD